MFQHRFANLFGVFALASFLTACGGGEPVVEIPLEPEDVRPLLVGTQAPAFTVQDPEGAAFKFDPENLEKPVLMIFYRGGWCPYCNAQLM
ncbi:MAG: redoxin domain-containing protein, partial [Gammaproteobacteria bacterium]|nr:redoxin domain-containing protein [Gammaproteobacteria bacterium]